MRSTSLVAILGAVAVATLDDMMTRSRGFPQFAACDAFLVDLYRRRAPGESALRASGVSGVRAAWGTPAGFRCHGPGR